MSTGLTVGDLAKKHVYTLNVDDTVQAAAQLMRDKKIGSVVVIEGKEAKGIITEGDIVRRVVAEGKPYTLALKEVMSAPLIVVFPETELEEALKAMTRHKVDRMVVITKEGYLAGIITKNDILNILPSIIELVEEKAKLEAE
ncbi:MAG: CBS domain-containing protein [Candidatus Micrarchaeota archaeon]|nr:CBS domain-containing protein [Candidatus Micrarchaeota archaeon]